MQWTWREFQIARCGLRVGSGKGACGLLKVTVIVNPANERQNLEPQRTRRKTLPWINTDRSSPQFVLFECIRGHVSGEAGLRSEPAASGASCFAAENALKRCGAQRNLNTSVGKLHKRAQLGACASA